MNNSLREWSASPAVALSIHGLAGNTTEREVKSLLLFAKGLIQCGLRSTSPGGGRVSAWATFSSHEAALSAKEALDGKNVHQGLLTVEFDKPSRPPIGARRNTTDGGLLSSQNSLYDKYHQQSHYPPGLGSGLGEFSPPASIEGGSGYAEHIPMYSNPQSPVHFADTTGMSYRMSELNTDMVMKPPRMMNTSTTKLLIAQDNNDDIVDAAGYLFQQDRDSMAGLLGGAKPRRATNPHQLGYGGLTAYGLSTSGMSHLNTNILGSAQMNVGMMPTPVTSPIGPPPNQSFMYRQNRMLPAVNPSDQNPPCNTLYVGNLPVGTSEDELKALFSRQRGYKRLCFRTKQNGPMCFVEFEDVGFATKALTELYGHNLSNSVKGGIRLSFSKNPLGVRSTTGNGPGGPTMPNASQHYPAPYTNGGVFATAQHAPPGLIHPTAQHSTTTMPLYVGR
ncbi:hypothetical protein DFH27DRAFT_112822 [Peziza echinospora]|nr:hypothetical protein DFH27DRAFT_112822 [Peziza echinospora]